jgi:DNA polymerase-3 subunit alpha
LPLAFSDLQDTVEDSTRDTVIYPDIPELSLHEKLTMEKESAGRFFSGHPIDNYTQAIEKLQSVSISNVLEYFDSEHDESTSRDKFVTTAGIIGDISVKRTKNGDNMAFFTLEDQFSAIEIVVFPKKYAQLGEYLKAGEVMAVNGNISPGREENAKIYLNNIIKLGKDGSDEKGEPNEPPVSVPSILYIKVPVFDETDITYKKAVNLIEIFEGTNEVKIYDASTKKVYVKKPGADLNPAFISEQRQILGEENVKIN